MDIIPISVNEYCGMVRDAEPVRVGVPLPCGELRSLEKLRLYHKTPDNLIPLQVKSLATWHDGSQKWILVSFFATIASDSKLCLFLDNNGEVGNESPIRTEEIGSNIAINTGLLKFEISKKSFFLSNFVNDNSSKKISTSCVLTDNHDKQYETVITKLELEEDGVLSSVFRYDGCFAKDEISVCDFFARVHFFANKKVVKFEFTLWNKKPARHLGGLWDLGDVGSFLFKSLNFVIKGQSTDKFQEKALYDTKRSRRIISELPLKIYQDSSGGENWDSKVHVNADGNIPVKFKGYQIEKDGHLLEGGDRICPVAQVKSDCCVFSATIEKFWQNFPKAIGINDNEIVVSLFPADCESHYELQGGERKTHTIYLDFSDSTESLSWVDQPLMPELQREIYSRAGVFTDITLSSQKCDKVVDAMISKSCLAGMGLDERREIIDEYGWRNFGEVYADHEAVYSTTEGCFVSHYNNQYDLVLGFLKQFISSADKKWYLLATELASHIVDIDIYHTNGDRAEYNNSLHWHTNHYLEAHTASHRSFSKEHHASYGTFAYGGGPSFEHCYSTGLLYHYYMTGNLLSYEAVLKLASWVGNSLNDNQTVLSAIFAMKNKISAWKKVLAGDKRIRIDEWPLTRGSGNSMNTLLDAFLLTKDQSYLNKVEQVMRSCIHPNDDIDSRNLLNAELAWSYTVCLQAIGRYLEVKHENQEWDSAYAYGQQSLLHYAKWMLKNECPYLDKKDELEFPNETWAAQDLRKSCIFYHAAYHCEGSLREEFVTKADYYHNYVYEALSSFDTHYLVRPLTIVLQNKWGASSFHENPAKFFPSPKEGCEFVNDNEFWTRSKVLKKVFVSFGNAVVKCDLHKERKWLMCRKYKHI